MNVTVRRYQIVLALIIALVLVLYGLEVGRSSVDEMRLASADSVGGALIEETFQERVQPSVVAFSLHGEADDSVYRDTWNWSVYRFQVDLYFSSDAVNATQPFKAEWRVDGPSIEQNRSGSSGALREEVMVESVGEFTDIVVTNVTCGGPGCEARWPAVHPDGVVRFRTVEGNGQQLFVIRGCRTLQESVPTKCFETG